MEVSDTEVLDTEVSDTDVSEGYEGCQEARGRVGFAGGLIFLYYMYFTRNLLSSLRNLVLKRFLPLASAKGSKRLHSSWPPKSVPSVA